MTHLLVGTPCYGGVVTTEYLASLLGLQRELAQRSIGFTLEMPASSLITVARNYVVSKVLANPQISHLLFIDADLGFDPAVVPRYLALEKDVVAGIYPIKAMNWAAVRQLPAASPLAGAFHYAVTLPDEEQTLVEGFVRAEYAATGFMLIRRQVLERMVAEHPELKYRHSYAHLPSQTATADHLYALFDTALDVGEQVYLPEDYAFCRRWRALGGEIWVDAFSRFRHVGQLAFPGDYSVFVRGLGGQQPGGA
ncbi:MAG TPA: hypothetical protein VMF30_14450 [Pirellulales bacterium]|nr:hypothetical protein [Pirellulales bacterium]